MDIRKILRFLPRLIIAAILFQTLYFKFTGSAESKFIFEAVGMEPWGRIGSGIAELIAVILLLTPRHYVLGAIISLGVICGALLSHLTVLGIEVMDDGGLLFILACVVFVCSLFVIMTNRGQLAGYPILSLLAPKKE